MNSRKKNLVIILMLGIAALVLFYLGGGIFIRQKKTYYERYNKLYALDFSRVSDITNEERKKYLEDLEVYRGLLEKGEKGDLVKSFIGLAFLKEQTLDYKTAEQALILAGEVDPNNFVSFGNLGNLHFYFTKDYPKAEQAYLKAIDNYPFGIDYYRDLGNLYQYHYDDIKKKEEVVIRAVRNNPRDPDAFKLAISFYIEQKDKDKAVWYHNLLKDISPEAAALFKEKINGL